MTKGTALGEARDRFVEGLPDRARELRGALALVTAAPGADRPREELLRRLRSLHSSAQVFRLAMLADALRERVQALEESEEEARDVDDDELESITNLIAVMPTLGQRTESQVGPLPTGPNSPSLPPRRKDAARRRKDTGRSFPSLQLENTSFPPPESSRGVMALLVVDSAGAVEQVKRAVVPLRCEVLRAETTSEALRIAKRRSPDVILVGREEASQNGTELITRLRSGRLTADIPIAVIYERGDAMDERSLLELGADTQIERNDGVLARRIAALGTVTRRPPSLERIGDTTLEQLASRLADELHRGIVDAASSNEAFSAGDGSELLAATWTAVEEVRAKIAERSAGRVRYREAGGPVFLSMDSSSGHVASPLGEQATPLEGRTLVVADDDPSTLWFFSNVLQEAGATVHEAQDGEEALALVRAHHPDGVISDIVMPKRDGLGLCRALAQDPAFAELPVVLISWKDDFLERAKELKAGAKGYLRKETESHVILSRVEEVLRPHLHLEESLTSGDDAQREAGGRVEGLGVYPVLRSVAKAKPDSRLTVLASHNLFEADIRGGQVVDVTRTADDGSFRRGQSALMQMLGVAHGRYVIHPGHARPSRNSVREGGDALENASKQLRAVARLLSTNRLNSVEVVRFDDDFLAPFLSELPSDVATGIRRIRTGVTPRVVAADTEGIREALIVLGKRGAVVELRGPGGEDLIVAARAELEVLDKSRLAGVDSEADDEGSADDNEAPEVDVAQPSDDDETDDDETDDDETDDDETDDDETDDDETDDDETDDDETDDDETDEDETDEDETDEDETDDDDDGSTDETDDMTPAQLAAWKSALDEDEDQGRRSDPNDWDSDSETEPGSRLRREKSEDALRKRLKAHSSAPPSTAAEEERPPSRFFLILGLCFAVGAGTCWAARNQDAEVDPPTSGASDEPTQTEAPADPTEPESVPGEPTVPTPEVRPEPEDSPFAFGTALELPVGADVQADEGLLVIQESATEVRVRLGGDSPRFLGSPPLQVALPEGRYEITFDAEGSQHIRYVFVRAGQSRVVSPPH